MQITNFVHKNEINWSLLTEGITLPVKDHPIFGRNMGAFLERGESKDILLILNGMTYPAKIVNVKFNEQKYKRSDVLQIRYRKNGEFANALKAIFLVSFGYIESIRKSRPQNDKTQIVIPNELKEFIVIYSTDREDTYVVEPLFASEFSYMKELTINKNERVMEDMLNYDFHDSTSGVEEVLKIVKIRKLNRMIGTELKRLYDFKCQICGENIGLDYGTRIVESHHIDYFVKSLNNDPDNQLIVCPNHHSIIHDKDPIFDRNKLIYTYPNGYKEGLLLNIHL